jgi:hypothetical protein
MTLHLEAPEVKVFVNGRHEPDWHCVEAVLGSGANVLPRAKLEVQPMLRDAGRLQVLNTQLASFDQPEIEVVKGTQVVHWGKVLSQPSSLSGEEQDQVTVISRMEPHHFGTPLFLGYFYDPVSRRPRGYSLPTVFNPEWDGKIVFNASPQKHPRWGTFLLLHPGSIETDDGKKYHKAKVPREWNLVDAVHYLCWALNSNQTYVRNPSRGELVAALPSETGLLRNHECPEGAYLPEQLDRLLRPFGCHWKVEFSKGSRKLVFFQRGRGPKRMLKLQGPGEGLDMTQSNLEAQQLTPDVSSRSFNAVRVYGDYKRVEATFELFRGWPDSLDGTSLDELLKDSEIWRTEQEKENVHRKWVLNEAGDYNDLRPEIGKPYDLSTILGAAYLPRRRKFLPCLTQTWDNCPVGLAHGIYIEWYDKEGALNGKAWASIEEIASEGRQIRILQRECGIYFDGLLPPAEIMDQGAEAKLRITACIESDQRAEVRIVRWPDSLLKDLKEEHLDVGSRFKIHTRHSSSRFAGVPLFTISEIDDTASMRAMANRLLDQWNLATLDGTATLTGVDYLYKDLVGSTIGGINGRNVDFNVAPPGAAPRYPTVVGARIDFIGQKVDLTLDTYREGL